MQDRCMRISCAKSLYADLLSKISLSGSLHQDPVGPLVQDLWLRIFASRSCRTSCAKSLYADLLCKMSMSRSSLQNPVGLLVQDLCMRLSSAYLCVRISASGSCMTTCERYLYADLLCKISLSGCLQLGPLVQDFCTRISCARSLCQDLCVMTSAGPLVEDPLPACANATSPAFFAMDTHDFRRELKSENATLYPHFARRTPTISAKGLSFETMLQKYGACHDIMSRGHAKCCTGHAKSSSSSSSKNATSLSGIEPVDLYQRFIVATSTKHCTCHDFHNVPDFLHLPRRLMFLTSTAEDFLAPACKMKFISESVHELR